MDESGLKHVGWSSKAQAKQLVTLKKKIKTLIHISTTSLCLSSLSLSLTWQQNYNIFKWSHLYFHCTCDVFILLHIWRLLQIHNKIFEADRWWMFWSYWATKRLHWTHNGQKQTSGRNTTPPSSSIAGEQDTRERKGEEEERRRDSTDGKCKRTLKAHRKYQQRCTEVSWAEVEHVYVYTV